MVYSQKELENILDGLGSRTEMGASFGVYGLRGYDIDIAMPRQEEATGRGHKDFKIYVDPFLGTYKAAMRRDFYNQCHDAGCADWRDY
mgnify:CR=1 FL=1